MKQCKVLHVNDGNPSVLHDGNFLFVEEFSQAESVITEYLNDGWEVKQIIPDIDPNPVEIGSFPFYHTGFVVYLEKEND